MPEKLIQANLETLDPQIRSFIEEKFSGHPRLDEVKEIVSRFSPRGQILISSYLVYSLEDNVFDKAWGILGKAWDEHYTFQHPNIRGDADLIKSNQLKFLNMMNEAGIKWPRQEEDETGPQAGEIKVITLKKDPELKKKLQRKLEEYKTRLNDRDQEVVQDARQKIIILSAVLKKGSVSIGDIKKQTLKELDHIDDEEFDVDVWVINEYCTKGGRGRTRGGTGLK